MKKYMLTSPIRHWKNGDKKTAIKGYFLNLFLCGAAQYITYKLVIRALERTESLPVVEVQL